LDALIQTRMVEDGDSLNPETITMLDPACGSGHILVEGYEVLKDIYLERGYRLRDIPRLILGKNLFGLDIDDRAAQLAGFALLMKARADDRRLLDIPPKLNVLALQESKGLDADKIVQSINTVRAADAQAIRLLIDTFAHAKTFGSLIQIPQGEKRGETLALQRLLTKRFGPIPNEVTALIANVSMEQIEAWFDLAIDATQIADVFGDASH
jgi:hypothetical protein